MLIKVYQPQNILSTRHCKDLMSFEELCCFVDKEEDTISCPSETREGFNGAFMQFIQSSC